MRSLFADALVLRLTPFREADVVVHVLTREAGTLSLMARGARKSRKRFGGVLDYFCALTAEIRPARHGMGSLLGVELLQSFEAVRRDVGRYYVGCHFLEVARRGVKEGDPAPELFRLLLSALGALDSESHPPSVLRVFQVKALGCLGYALALETCPVCGRDLAGCASLAAAGRVGCSTCAGPAGTTLSAGALHTLRAAAGLPLDRLGCLRFTAAAEAETGLLLDAAVGAALGIELRRQGP